MNFPSCATQFPLPFYYANKAVFPTPLILVSQKWITPPTLLCDVVYECSLQFKSLHTLRKLPFVLWFFLEKKIKISSSLNIFHTLKQGLFPLLTLFFAQGIYCLFIKINQNCVCSKLFFCLRVNIHTVSNVTAHSTELVKLYLVVIWFTVGML